MALRITPYLFNSIDWSDPTADPIRKQFIPMLSESELDHPLSKLDAMDEKIDSPVKGLTHRYPDRVLFIANNICPIYCRYCTRSYTVGESTATNKKDKMSTNKRLWGEAFDYISGTPTVHDVVVSGGDTYRLRPEQILHIGNILNKIPHVKRYRLATRGLSADPMKLFSNDGWFDAVKTINQQSKLNGKWMSVHTHFNHPKEITLEVEEALTAFRDSNITVRNQSVLLRGVNDESSILLELIQKLANLGVQPYYIFLGDMVPGAESTRVSLSKARQLDKELRGRIAGFLTPQIVVDLPNGGGKKSIHTFDSYDEDTGLSVWSSQSVKPGTKFLYADPLHYLSEEAKKQWLNKEKCNALISRAKGQ